MATKRMAESAKSFIVVSGDLRLRVTPDGGWYVGESLDVRGLVVQAETIEQLIIDAEEVAMLLKESRSEWLRENASRPGRRKRRTA